MNACLRVVSLVIVGELGLTLASNPNLYCFECADQCTELTNELGCAGLECVEACKYCDSGVDWDDLLQHPDCNCHNNGCDQCQDGWFKIDYDFPCQSCAEVVGCLHCSDFIGCQQCADGYTLVEHATCGENSKLNTDNTKVHYCVPYGEEDCAATSSEEPHVCEDAPTYVSDDSRLIVVDCKQSWDDAQDYCMDTYGTSLATSLSLEDDEIMDDLCSLAEDENPTMKDGPGYVCWMGLLGLDYDAGFEWGETGQTPDDTGYSHWGTNFPRTSDGTCGMIGSDPTSTDPGQMNSWYNMGCDSFDSPFICKYPKGVDVTMPPTKQPTEEPMYD